LYKAARLQAMVTHYLQAVALSCLLDLVFPYPIMSVQALYQALTMHFHLALPSVILPEVNQSLSESVSVTELLLLQQVFL